MSDKCIGLFDRSGEPSDTQNGVPGYRAVFGGYVINDSASPNGGINWSSLQAVAGSPVGSGAITNANGAGTGSDAIDSAFNAVATYNLAQSGSKIGGPWTLKIRVFLGIAQPSWLASALSQGTITNGGTLTPYWTNAYLAAYKQFQLKLAAYVPGDGLGYTLDTHPNLGEVACHGGPTYAEPLLLSSAIPGSPWTLAQLGATATQLQNACQTAWDDCISAWPNTAVSFAMNPCAYGGSTFTQAMIQYVVTSASQPARADNLNVLENNSLRANAAAGTNSIGVYGPFTGNDPNTGHPWYIADTIADYTDGHDGIPPPYGGGYSLMYSQMASFGNGQMTLDLGLSRAASPNPITIQTDTYSKNGNTGPNLENTLSYAVELGARMVELPAGYANGCTPTQLSKYTAGLLANDPHSTLSGQVIQHITGATTAAGTSLVVANALTSSANMLILFVGVRGASTPTASVSGGGTWNSRFSQATGANNGKLQGFDITGVAIAANGITISSTVSGSIEYQFYEISGLAAFEAKANASGSSTAPTVSITPSNVTDVVVGGILWPDNVATISPGTLSGTPWATPDGTVVGIG